MKVPELLIFSRQLVIDIIIAGNQVEILALTDKINRLELDFVRPKLCLADIKSLELSRQQVVVAIDSITGLMESGQKLT